LPAEPRPAEVKRLAGQEGLRIRVGDWRILCEVREREVVVLVVRIGPRGEVYERLGGRRRGNRATCCCLVDATPKDACGSVHRVGASTTSLKRLAELSK
jgi:hypothetical protein